MQTFLPFPDMAACAEVLDNKRVFKQLVEAKQILITLRKRYEEREIPGTWPKIGWKNHPAVLMWEGYEYRLATYMDTMLTECSSRNIAVTHSKYLEPYKWGIYHGAPSQEPWWWGGPIHYTHRVRLCEKDWEHYSPLFPDVIDSDVGDMDYHWPVVSWEHIVPKPSANPVAGSSRDWHLEVREEFREVRDPGMAKAMQNALDAYRDFQSRDPEGAKRVEAALTGRDKKF